MALRLIEIFSPKSDDKLPERIPEDTYIDLWIENTADDVRIIRILADVEYTEKIMDTASSFFGDRDDFRIVLVPVVASVPRAPIDEEEDENVASAKNKQDEKDDNKVSRISKSEMFEEVKGMVELSWVYVTLTVMACVVAASGMIRDNPAIVIGAMVIAPILGPNVGLSMATTLGDKKLLIQSLKSVTLGFMLGLVFSVLMGVVLTFDPAIAELKSRTVVGYGDIILGFAAGVAGVMSFTRGISAAVIGVMVAVALLPPLVATGLFLGSAMLEEALGAALLTITYVICFNLAGIITLLIQGVRPKSWQEKRDDANYSPFAVIFWVVLLIIMAGIIYLREVSG